MEGWLEQTSRTRFVDFTAAERATGADLACVQSVA